MTVKTFMALYVSMEGIMLVRSVALYNVIISIVLLSIMLWLTMMSFSRQFIVQIMVMIHTMVSVLVLNIEISEDRLQVMSNGQIKLNGLAYKLVNDCLTCNFFVRKSLVKMSKFDKFEDFSFGHSKFRP